MKNVKCQTCSNTERRVDLKPFLCYDCEKRLNNQIK